MSNEIKTPLTDALLESQQHWPAIVMTHRAINDVYKHARQLERELATAKAEVERIKQENESLLMSLPHINGPVRNEVQNTIGEVLRHNDGETASHGCVEVQRIVRALETIIADRNCAIEERDQLKQQLADLQLRLQLTETIAQRTGCLMADMDALKQQLAEAEKQRDELAMAVVNMHKATINAQQKKGGE